MLHSSARRHVPQRAAAGLQHAADGGHGHGARQLAPCRPAAGRAEEHGGDDYPDPRQGRRLDRGGDLVGLVPDHNLERTINIFELANLRLTLILEVQDILESKTNNHAPIRSMAGSHFSSVSLVFSTLHPHNTHHQANTITFSKQ